MKKIKFLKYNFSNEKSLYLKIKEEIKIDKYIKLIKKKFNIKNINIADDVLKEDLTDTLDDIYNAFSIICKELNINYDQIGLDNDLNIYIFNEFIPQTDAGRCAYNQITNSIEITAMEHDKEDIFHEWFHYFDYTLGIDLHKGGKLTTFFGYFDVRYRDNVTLTYMTRKILDHNTLYYKNAVKADNLIKVHSNSNRDYCSHLPEIAARCFEIYIREKMRENNDLGDYYNNKSHYNYNIYSYKEDGKQQEFITSIMIYPNNKAEIEMVCDSFDVFFDELHKMNYLKENPDIEQKSYVVKSIEKDILDDF